MGHSPAGRHDRARAAFWPILLASTALAGIPQAYADEPPKGGPIETVVVTAEKRAEDIQKVPFSIIALDGTRLQQLNVASFTDYVKFLPSVNYTVGGAGGGNAGPGFANVSMRGVTSGNDGNHSGSLPTVGIYLDEQPITTIGGALDVRIYDIARVESLAGPQGTLYGASSEAGTIRIITNKPDPSAFSAGYDVEGNSVEHGGLGGSLEGFVNIPIADNAAIRLVAWDEHDAGYINNVKGTRTYPTAGVTISNASIARNGFNYVDTMGGRAALEIDLDDNWTITPTLMGQTEHSNGTFGFDPSVGDLEVKHFYPEYVHDYWYQAALTVQGKIGNLDLTYSGGHMDRWIHEQSDYTDYSYWYDNLYHYVWYDNANHPVDPSQYINAKDHFTKDSHEIRVASPSDQRLRFVGGLFYERQGHWILQDYKINALGSNFWVPGWPQTIWLTDQERVDRDFAAFGEVNFDITPDLTVTGGLRGFEADNSLDGFFGFSQNFSSHTGVSQCPTPTFQPFHGAPCTNLDKSVVETGYTHKLSVKYQLTDDKMVYATWSTGFRPGGINRRGTIPPYQPDKLTNYEIGWKTAWLNDTLRFNGAAFWEDWHHFQFSFLGLNSFTEIHNGPSATIRGVEADLDWAVDDHLTLTGSGTFADGHTTANFCGPTGVTVCPSAADPFPPDAPKGSMLPDSPKYKGNLTGRYEFTIGGFLAHLQSSLQYQSSALPDLRSVAAGTINTGVQVPINSALGRMPSFAQLDLSAGVQNDLWSIEIFATNVTDTRGQNYRYAECVTQVCEAEPYIVTTTPRLVGIRFGQRF